MGKFSRGVNDTRMIISFFVLQPFMINYLLDAGFVRPTDRLKIRE